MDRGAWRAAVHGVAESRTRSMTNTHTQHKVFKWGKFTYFHFLGNFNPWIPAFVPLSLALISL